MSQGLKDFWACRHQTLAWNQSSDMLSDGLGAVSSAPAFISLKVITKQCAWLCHNVLISIYVTILYVAPL